VGEDTFYDANKADYTYVSSYHGTKSNAADASYSLYSVINKDGGKALELTSVNTMRNWIVTKYGVSGAYSAQVDIQFVDNGGSSEPCLVLNPFQGYTFPDGKTIMVYAAPKRVRILDNATTGSNVSYDVLNSAGSRLTVDYGVWHTVKVTVAEGKFSVKVWPRGSAEPASGAGVVTLSTPAITAAAMANANTLRIANQAVNKPGEAYTTLVDNLQIYKTYDSMTLPATVFGVPVGSVTPDLRKKAKAVNFGILYGMGAYSLSEDLHISQAQAKAYIASYFAAYPQIDGYLKSVIADAYRDGYVTTLLGRRRYIPELKMQNKNMQHFGERVAMNSPIQGTAADVIKLAMIRVHQRLKASHLDARLILQVHDELLIEAHRDCADEAKRILQEEMERAVSYSVPLNVDIHVGNTWFDAK
jgi:hypothetical protein